jgi:hypothetical protein
VSISDELKKLAAEGRKPATGIIFPHQDVAAMAKEAVSSIPLTLKRLASPRWRVAYAYSPRENTGSRANTHIVLGPDEKIDVGRYHRDGARFDALCRPARKFWGLTETDSTRTVTCPLCLIRALQHGVIAQAIADGLRALAGDL